MAKRQTEKSNECGVDGDQLGTPAELLRFIGVGRNRPVRREVPIAFDRKTEVLQIEDLREFAGYSPGTGTPVHLCRTLPK